MNPNRFVPASRSIFYVYAGPCALVSPLLCHGAFCLMMLSWSVTMYLITVGFAYRLYIMQR